MGAGDLSAGTGRLEERGAVCPYLAMPGEKIQLGTRRLMVAVDCGFVCGGEKQK